MAKLGRHQADNERLARLHRFGLHPGEQIRTGCPVVLSQQPRRESPCVEIGLRFRDEVDQLRYSLGTENTMMVFPRQALRVILNGPSLYEPFELGSL